MTAQAMVGSAFTAPHVTEFVTIDVSATMELVERLKGADLVGRTYTPPFAYYLGHDNAFRVVEDEDLVGQYRRKMASLLF